MAGFGFVLASKMLIDNRRKVRYMYREQVNNRQDSGWRFFCGDEDDAYVNDPNHIGIYDIKTLLEIDRSIIPYLDCVPPSALERENEDDVFVFCQDFDSEQELIEPMESAFNDISSEEA